MGRTVPTFVQLIEQAMAHWLKFRRALRREDQEYFDKIFDSNVKGVLFTAQKALPLLVDGGSIILNASIVSSKGMPAFSVYSATKAAMHSFTLSQRYLLKDTSVKVLDGCLASSSKRQSTVL